ncbi:hypothetical protein [Acaryochloris marina]|uniref:hypothetical protein n=1 Tax=Acaryochloris marina TaxID=155978 RepID=UPI0021C48953|nr:hypothetical protein [Acaryochloris marina]BDM83538.1 hypothetical protein AM10699_63990 [Acaryochloris marina MBIC10699]
MDFRTPDPDNPEPWMPQKKRVSIRWKPIALVVTICGAVGVLLFVNGHPANEQICKKVHGGWFMRHTCYNADL